MAYFRIGPKGGVTETVLWTNSSPSSEFKAQTVTLSQSIANFTYIGVHWKVAYSGTASEASTIYPKDNVVSSKSDVSSQSDGFMLVFGAGKYSTNARRCRVLYYVSNTSLGISKQWTLDNTATSATSGQAVIPLTIFGLK